MLSVVNTITKTVEKTALASAVASIKNIKHPTGRPEEEFQSIRDMLLTKSNEGSIDLLIDDKLATITINNLHKRNAITEKMMVDFYNCVNYLSEWNGNFIILKGTGHTFCSGFDLQAAPRYTKDPKGKLLLSEFMQDTCNRFKRLPIPSLSFIEGYAMGGGAEMTTCTDFRIMQKDAKVKFVHATLGLSPAWGGSSRLTTIIGKKNALYYTCSAKVITSEIGEKLNYSEGTMNEEELPSFYEPFLKNYTGSIHALKTIISNMESDVITEDIMRIERDVFEALYNSKSCQSGFENNRVAKKYMDAEKKI